MPRGMDERFEDPTEDEGTDSETATETTSESTGNDRIATEESGTQSNRDEQASQDASGSASADTIEDEDEPLNIREDWDSATLYVEPNQSEDIEITFTRLKKQLKRDGIILEKNKHFYRGVFEVAFNEHREETKQKIRELAKEDG